MDANAYRLSLPLYVYIYSMVNVENVKWYEPFISDQETKKQVVPTTGNLPQEAQGKLVEDIAFCRKV